MFICLFIERMRERDCNLIMTRNKFSYSKMVENKNKLFFLVVKDNTLYTRNCEFEI